MDKTVVSITETYRKACRDVGNRERALSLESGLRLYSCAPWADYFSSLGFLTFRGG